MTLANVKITAKITFETAPRPRRLLHHIGEYRVAWRTAQREREREVDTIRVHNRSDVTGEIDRPGWNHTDGERDTRVLGPRTRNSPEMTVPRALFRQSAARFIANFRASITETMAANRCPCIPPCTSVRHRDPIESWSPIKWKARLRIIHTSLIHGKNFSFQLFSSSLKKKNPSYFSVSFYPHSSLCFFVFSRNGSFSSLLPLFSFENGNRSRVCFLYAIIRLENCIIISAEEKLVVLRVSLAGEK